MSASLTNLSFPSTGNNSLQAPSLGATRRGIAALAAVTLLAIGLSGWTHLDATQVQQTIATQTR